MSLIVQDDTGSVADANAYVTLVEFKAWHAARGNDLSTYADPAIEQAIIAATSYVDTRFSYIGRPFQRQQTTQWPRYGARDSGGWYLNDVHHAVKVATFEYGLRALSAKLMPDPVTDPSGRLVESQTEKVGPIETSVKYAEGHGTQVLPSYPAADLHLKRAGLVHSGRQLERA